MQQHSFHDGIGAFAVMIYLLLILPDVIRYSFCFCKVSFVHFQLHLINQLGVYLRKIIDKV